MSPRPRRGRPLRAKQAPAAPPQLGTAETRNPYPPLNILSAGQVEAIDREAMRILSELGLRVQHPEARKILQQHGAQPDAKDKRILYFPAGMVRDAVAKAPAEFTLHARNPKRSVRIGGNAINFAPVSGPPNVSDLKGGRRPGTFADQQNLIRLLQTLNIMHMSGGTPVEAIDLPAETRHLDFYHTQACDTDRIWMARAIGRERVTDALMINALSRGLQLDDLIESPGIMTVINVNSPLVVDREMLTGLMEMTRYGQPCIITPFTLAGAMSPITLAGALAQQTAEALAVIALVQLIRPGCPTVLGGFTSNVDMKTGSPAFGTPEYIKGVLAGGQLARHYGLPYRASNVNASNAVDAQATYESCMSLWACFLAHTNVVNHAVGWMESGLCASYEKYIIDTEMLQTLHAAFQPLKIGDDEFGFDSIKQAGHGGHFFGTDHTMARYTDAFYRPLLSDWQNFENWQKSGSQTATERAADIWQSLLDNYEPPPMPADWRTALDDFVKQRKREAAA